MSLEKSLIKLKKQKKNVDRENLIYKTNKHKHDFRKCNTIRIFGEDIHQGKITLEEADESQSDLLGEIKKLNDKTRPQALKKTKNKKKNK